MYNQRGGAPSHRIRNASPSSAVTQITVSSSTRELPVVSCRASGVYVAAMKTKMLEWSQRRSRAVARGLQFPRW